MNKFTKVNDPINSNDRYLYAIVERLDHLIDVLAKEKCDGKCKTQIEEVTKEIIKVAEPVAPKKTVRKTTTKKEVTK